jgi:site-specific DNA recombinase
MSRENLSSQDVEKSHFRRSAVNRARLSDSSVQIDEIEDVRVAIYVRVSKEDDANEGYSIEAQKNVCKELCAARKWTIVEIYEEPGVSAKDDKRPEFQRMIADSAKERFNTVLIHKLDRFSRNIDNTLHYFKVLSINNVVLVSATEKFDYSSAQGRLFFRMMAVFAQWYLENLSAEAIKGKEEMFRQGRHNGAPPFGYLRNEKTREVEIVPAEAEYIKMAFELAASGTYTHQMIADVLNKKFKTRKGNNWSKDTVTSLLRNEFFYGMVAHLDEIRPGQHQPIISKELYEKVQEITTTRARTPRNFLFKKHSKSGKPVIATEEHPAYYLLQRIIRCNACERQLRIQTTGTHRYYREVSAERGLSCVEEKKSIRMDLADQAVISLLGQLHLPDDWQDEIRKRAKDKDAILQIKARKADLEDKIKRLDSVYLNGSYEHAAYQEQRAKLLDELNRLVVPDQSGAIEQGIRLENLKDLLANATPAELNDICRAMLDAVYTDFVGHRIVRFKPASELIEIFRLAAPFSGWREISSGDFEIMRMS